MSDRYPTETLDPEYDNGTMPENVEQLASHVIGHRIISAETGTVKTRWGTESAFVITLDDGTQVSLADTNDCCAYTALESFLLDPSAVDHIITGVGTTDGYTVWHIYADWGDILKLEIGWSSGNPFYYGYGFDIHVQRLPVDIAETGQPALPQPESDRQWQELHDRYDALRARREAGQ